MLGDTIFLYLRHFVCKLVADKEKEHLSRWVTLGRVTRHEQKCSFTCDLSRTGKTNQIKTRTNEGLLSRLLTSAPVGAGGM